MIKKRFFAWGKTNSGGGERVHAWGETYKKAIWNLQLTSMVHGVMDYGHDYNK